ncbi:protein kinase [Streptomyces sp. NPDC056716]|uniref:serine/threonine-protein kinase n=1 Tax=unclassified Streptomyces TaxID=2593676 RepID=UPI0036A279F2
MQGLRLGDRYRLTEAIGSGGMGRVWRAHDEVLNRAVAIKELTAALYASDSDQSVLLARTRAEARAAARINHSAVVTVHDVLEHDGRPWIVMELVEGYSLADAVKENSRIEPAEAARIGLWVLRALRAAHTAGVLHRDVKPGNVLLARDGRVLLTDFGIAQIEGDSTITRTGEVVGSVDYLAPERVRGHDPGPAADLWALGATLYAAVEGLSPFRRTSPLGTMQAVVEEEPEPPTHAGALAPVITALLRKDPAARPGIAETEQLLAEAAEGRRPRAAQAYVPTSFAPAPSHSGSHSAGAGGAGGAGGATGSGTPAQPPTPYPSTPHSSTPYRPTPYASAPYPPTPYASAPYPPVTGPTAVGPHPPGGGGPGPMGLPGGPAGPSGSSGPVAPSGPARPPRRQRRLRTLALVVAVAALVGGGTAVVLEQRYGGEGSPQGQQQNSPSPESQPESEPESEPTPSQGQDGQDGQDEPVDQGAVVPEGWVSVTDPLGFGLSLPEGWERQEPSVSGDIQQVDYTPDSGRHFLRIAVDSSPDYADPYAHLLDLDQQLGDRLVDYQQTSLERNIYRDRSGARWEYSWTALAKDTAFPGPYRAVDQMNLSRDGVEYALYMAAPAEEWETAVEEFEAVLRSWSEPGAESSG